MPQGLAAHCRHRTSSAMDCIGLAEKRRQGTGDYTSAFHEGGSNCYLALEAGALGGGLQDSAVR